MARFARDVLQTVNDLTKKLEVTLGPDTGDLQIRTGLHSGPVTAGVLRGEKSRFQLFGDTVNTAARIESTGAPSRIQLSSETADLLIAAGKSNWIREREEKVRAKGKGELQTYWLEVRHEGSASVTSGSSNSDLGERNDLNMPQPAAQIKSSAPTARPLDAKAKRLVDWNCDQMVRLLKYVVARRKAQGHCADATVATEESNGLHSTNLRKNVGTVLEEVREIIMLPKFDPRVYRNHDDPGSVELDDDVLQQLHDYVSTIATLYRDNPFHNFEHASHVTMSVSKLLSRIVSPQDINRSHATDDGEQQIEEYAWEVHKSTYGITSDPLTQFAVVFSALIHDGKLAFFSYFDACHACYFAFVHSRRTAFLLLNCLIPSRPFRGAKCYFGQGERQNCRVVQTKVSGRTKFCRPCMGYAHGLQVFRLATCLVHKFK